MPRKSDIGGGFGKREAVILFTLLAALLAVFTFEDLPLSRAVYDPASGFGLFFAAFGPFGGSLSGAFCTAALFMVYPPRKAMWYRTALFALLLIACSAYAALTPLSLLGIAWWLVFPIAAALMCAAILLASAAAQPLASRALPERRAGLGRAAKIGLCTFASETAAMWLIKWLWGRWRFKAMTPDLSRFTPWYLPRPFARGDAQMSFLSGHSSDAAVLVWLLLLPEFLPIPARLKWVPRAVAYGWTALTMISRVVLGMHFGSDVVCGAALTFGLFALWCRVIKRPAGER